MKSGNIFQQISFLLSLTSAKFKVDGFKFTNADDASSYKAAVYEHPVILPAKRAESYDEAVDQMMLNLNEFKRQADIAGSQGVDIIVFPEDGIYGFNFSDPKDIELYLEYIPDPHKINWTPCSDPDRFKRTKVQTFLSCLALNNSFYLVANYGDAQPCTSNDPNCPKNGQYQYNTNIVFDRKGKLIARYHKENLYYETQFQTPAFPERVVFDTEFGRFGTFTCFDILFYEPAIPLIEHFNITDVVFPTAWMDSLPYFSAIGYHSSFAFAYNVNFLSANIHLPNRRFQGSGIYTPNGAVIYHYDSDSQDGELLVHEVPILKRNFNDPRKISFTFGDAERQYIKKHDFTAEVRRDRYNFVTLGSIKGNITVCMDGLCCFLSYQRNQIVGNYAFGVYNARHRGRYYLQVCILLKCASENNQECGKVIKTADGYFSYFNIKGNFSTPYVTPQIVTSRNGSLELPPHHAMQYDSNGLTGNATTSPLLETALIGRIYDVSNDDATSASDELIPNKINTVMQIAIVLYLKFVNF